MKISGTNSTTTTAAASTRQAQLLWGLCVSSCWMGYPIPLRWIEAPSQFASAAAPVRDGKPARRSFLQLTGRRPRR